MKNYYSEGPTVAQMRLRPDYFIRENGKLVGKYLNRDIETFEFRRNGLYLMTIHVSKKECPLKEDDSEDYIARCAKIAWAKAPRIMPKFNKIPKKELELKYTGHIQ